MGILEDILDVIVQGGRQGVLISVISRKANLSHYTVLDKCKGLISAGLVESSTVKHNRIFLITEKGIQELVAARDVYNELSNGFDEFLEQYNLS